VKAAQRLGIDYETLSAVNPRLVYAHISGFGTKGPYAEKGGYDRLTQGLSGVMARRDANGTPMTAGILVSDPSVPMMLSYGIMLALWARERTGKGQKVETSLLQAAVAMQAPHLIKVEDEALNEGDPAAYGIFRCADTYINVCALTPPQFRRLCQVLDLEHLADDPRATDFARRAEFRADAFPVIEGVLTTRPAKEWLTLLEEADVPSAPILDSRQVFEEPQLLENGMLTTVQHPSAGAVSMFTPPVQLSDTPGGIRHLAPSLGAHTDEVLRELGFGDSDIADMRAREIVR
ncbi:MAG: CoA transferase, partial [Chloroflexi bacterium]|nr:CoA transferase [Chloroflexota bacterium]